MNEEKLLLETDASKFVWDIIPPHSKKDEDNNEALIGLPRNGVTLKFAWNNDIQKNAYCLEDDPQFRGRPKLFEEVKSRINAVLDNYPVEFRRYKKPDKKLYSISEVETLNEQNTAMKKELDRLRAKVGKKESL